jgi:hypothetical protein
MMFCTRALVKISNKFCPLLEGLLRNIKELNKDILAFQQSIDNIIQLGTL